jgi:hypothetical protein
LYTADIIISPTARKLYKVQQTGWYMEKEHGILKVYSSDAKEESAEDLEKRFEDAAKNKDNWKKQKDVEEDRLSIIFSRKILSYSTKEVYIILLKAMVLLYDIQMTNAYKYEGKKWKRLINNNEHYFSKEYYKMCEEVGLVPAWNPKTDDEMKKYKKQLQEGSMQLVPTGVFEQVYESNAIEELFKMVYTYTDLGANKRSTQSMRLFRCTNCGMPIRLTKKGKIDIRCYNEETACNGAIFEEEK